MALVTLSAANRRSSLRFLLVARSPNACLMLPSTPLSGGGSKLRPGSTVDGETGDLPKSKGEAESSILCALGLLGGRGDPAWKAMQKKVEEQATIKIDFRGQHNESFFGFKVKINMPESRQLKNWYEREFLCAILEEKRKKKCIIKRGACRERWERGKTTYQYQRKKNIEQYSLQLKYGISCPESPLNYMRQFGSYLYHKNTGLFFSSFFLCQQRAFYFLPLNLRML